VLTVGTARRAGVAQSSGGSGLVNQAFDEMRKIAFKLPAQDGIGKQVGLDMDKRMTSMVADLFVKDGQGGEATLATSAQVADLAKEHS